MACLVLAAAFPAEAAGVAGVWKTAGADGGLVRVKACGEAICGRITGLPPQYAAEKDIHNRDPALRARSMEGLLIFKLTPEGPNRWGNGSIYDPDDGHSYKASVTLGGDGRLRLKGCLIGPLCRTQTWMRAGSLAGGKPPTPPS
ncbi:MAG TPA: DUF2147 domain-containing protein [Caulobacteraceae bacterium]|jgi:uncharacterized protein (DUF2147 family)